MEGGIRSLRKSLGTFCNHLDSSCDALKQSLDRRPIPLDSVSSSFLKGLNRRLSSASSDLNVLDSMTFWTVSFEELLGHCNEVYKKNQSDLVQLQDRLKSFGYCAPVEEEVHGSLTPRGLEANDLLDPPSSYCGPASMTGSIMKSLEQDALSDESPSLKKLGLSEACLATLASEGEVEERLKSVEAPKHVIKVSNENYESLPSYMKGLASWEDLLDAVEKINSSQSKKDKTEGRNYFHQDEISSLGLGPKARSYLLLLVRLNRLVVETIDGSVSYRVL